MKFFFTFGKTCVKIVGLAMVSSKKPIAQLREKPKTGFH